MKRLISLASFVFVLGLFFAAASAQADWLTLPGRYSHDSFSGQRVAQYAQVEAPTLAAAAPLRTSGYTHTRSSLNYGQSADNYHRVEQWGDPVRPYGEWRFPYRPFSTPYPNWGAPYAGLQFNNNFLGSGGFGGGGFGGGGPGQGMHPGHGTHPGQGFHPGGGMHPGNGGQFPNPAAGADGFAPYPSGRGTPYPVAPYYDGYYPNYRD